MLAVSKSDLAYGAGTKTGLPRSLVGGMKLNTPEMPVCAAGRLQNGAVQDTEVSYAMARGCVKLLKGELSSVELVGSASDASPAGVHLVLANGTSHAWIGIADAPNGAGKVLRLSGMPFSGQIVNYNAGITLGLFVLLHKDAYPDFAAAAGKAVEAASGQDEKLKAQSVALMADEMAYVIEQIIDGSDPLGLSAVLLDREQPTDLQSTFDGGDDLKQAFVDKDTFHRLVGSITQQQTPTVNESQATGFLGNLPVKLTDCIQRGKHVLLTGPTATGKTMAVEEVCARLGAPMTVIRGSEGLEDRDLIGATVLETASENGGIATKTRFTYGPLPEAMMLGKAQYERHLREVDDARREGREPVRIPPSVLLIDEINRLQLRFQNFLVSAMNVRGATMDYHLRIPDTNEEITCPDSFLVIVAARNVGGVFAGTNPMDLALERRFYKKIDLQYLPPEQETQLVQSRTGLDPRLTQVLVKVAADTRFQLAQLKAPIDTDTLLKWAEELAWLKLNGSQITEQLMLETAKDVVFDICLERSERGGFDQAGEAVLTDNISENWRDVFPAQ